MAKTNNYSFWWVLCWLAPFTNWSRFFRSHFNGGAVMLPAAHPQDDSEFSWLVERQFFFSLSTLVEMLQNVELSGFTIALWRKTIKNLIFFSLYKFNIESREMKFVEYLIHNHILNRDDFSGTASGLFFLPKVQTFTAVCIPI